MYYGGEKWISVGITAESGENHHPRIFSFYSMFIGEYTHSLDTKGRVALPAKFRAKLGDGAILTRGLDRSLLI